MTLPTKKGLFHPCYFAPVYTYAKMLCYQELVFEVFDHYQKQTYRNRCYIYAQQGRQLLNVPVKRSSSVKQFTKEVRIDYSENWQQQHFRAIKTAYSASPFFEFYEDDLATIYSKKHEFLLDLNVTTHQFLMECLELKIPFKFSESYEREEVEFDHRELVNSKQEPNFNLEKYTQNFENKHGFLPNLSVLDLLFMEGPCAADYLFSVTFFGAGLVL